MTYEQLYLLIKGKTFTINTSLLPNYKTNKIVKIDGVSCFMKIYSNFSDGKKMQVEQEILDSVFSFYIGLGLLNASHEQNKPYTIKITVDGLKLFTYIYEKLTLLQQH